MSLRRAAACIALAALARAGRTEDAHAPNPAFGPGCVPGVALDLLRNEQTTDLDPLTPTKRTTFASFPSDPALRPVQDLEVADFASGAPFPHEASDLAPGPPLVLYQLTSPVETLHVTKVAGRLAITYGPASGRSITLPRPGGGAMIGGARAGLLLLADGTVWTWGADFRFRLGQGNAVMTDLYVPTQVHGPGNVGLLQDIECIAAGEPFSVALARDGTVWTWGDNGAFGELGIGDIGVQWSNAPVQPLGPSEPGSCLDDIELVAARGYHALALAGDGTVYAWGMNTNGECGTGDVVTPQPTPVPVRGLPPIPIASLSGGFSYSLALASDGTLWGWGSNANGEMADSTFNTPVLVPRQIGPSNVKQVSAGWKHVLALRDDGTVWAWGENGYGQVGDGTLADVNVPHEVPGPGGVGVLSDVVMVSAGDCHSAALKRDGTVWTWGCNHHNGFNPPPAGSDPVGQLGNGDGTYRDQPYPVQVVGGEQGGAFLDHVLAIAARDYHDFALTFDGTLYAWGSNLNGQIGNGTCCLPATSPVRVTQP